MDMVIRVAKEIRGYTLGEAERLCDEIFQKQPVAMAYVVVLSRRGVPFPLLDHALHLLMVIYACFREAGVELEDINEDMLAKAWNSTISMARFFAGEPCETERDRLIALGVTGYPEPFLLAYWVTCAKEEFLRDGFTAETGLVLGATKSLLDCFVQASAGKGT
ncbi:conserved hypothetical protein [sediment metagenome]|uniref:Uncharacterized protein n=1 Tax=sediment metagenome TaxID=749907 RepID=D9PIH6_9ZZZZ